MLSTGDEVVEPSLTPGPGQIRNGNGPMLLAQVSRTGGVPRFLGIARDCLESLVPLLEEGLRSAVLVLSGGDTAATIRAAISSDAHHDCPGQRYEQLSSPRSALGHWTKPLAR